MNLTYKSKIFFADKLTSTPGTLFKKKNIIYLKIFTIFAAPKSVGPGEKLSAVPKSKD